MSCGRIQARHSHQSNQAHPARRSSTKTTLLLHPTSSPPDNTNHSVLNLTISASPRADEVYSHPHGTARSQASPQPPMPELFPQHHCGSPHTQLCCVQAQKTTHWWVLLPQFGTQTEVRFAEMMLLWKSGFQTPEPCFPGLVEDKGQRRSLGDLGDMKILCKCVCFKMRTPGQPGKLPHE